MTVTLLIEWKSFPKQERNICVHAPRITPTPEGLTSSPVSEHRFAADNYPPPTTAMSSRGPTNQTARSPEKLGNISSGEPATARPQQMHHKDRDIQHSAKCKCQLINMLVEGRDTTGESESCQKKLKDSLLSRQCGPVSPLTKSLIFHPKTWSSTREFKPLSHQDMHI